MECHICEEIHGEQKYNRTLGFREAGRIPDYAKSADGKLHKTVFYYKRLIF
jgi:hypothetical protein